MVKSFEDIKADIMAAVSDGVNPEALDEAIENIYDTITDAETAKGEAAKNADEYKGKIDELIKTNLKLVEKIKYGADGADPGVDKEDATKITINDLFKED